MKNKILILLYLIFLLCFSSTKTFSKDEFSFDVTNIEIFENGKIFKGTDRGTIRSNTGIILTADNFEYNKNKNILTANGLVVIEDKINNLKLFTDNIIYEKNNEKIITNGNSKAIYNKNKIIEGKFFEYNKKLNLLNARKNVIILDKLKNYVLEAEEVSYFKNNEKILTKGSTKANINNNYEIKSKNIIFFVDKNILESNNKTIIKDKKNQVFNLEKFQFSLNNEILKGDKITYITNFGSPKSDKLYFSNAIVDLKNNNFIAKDTLIEVHNDVFGNSENNPRLKGVSSKKKGNITKIEKGIFTSCKANDNCPPWSIQAKEIIHDKNKKQLIYNKALLKFYDLPILYFPKFFHPDPTVKRQSGFLQPRLNNSNILGNSISIPYFYANSENKDFTFTPSFFDKNIKVAQTEFRQANKFSNLIADFAFINGFKSKDESTENTVSHLFAKFDLDLNWDNFISSNFYFLTENVSKDTYLKIFDTNLNNTDLKPKNFDNLTNEAKLTLTHNDYYFETGFQAFENLQLSKTDRYQYILPYYNFNKIVSDDFFKGSLSFQSDGTNDLNYTNNLKTNIVNNLNYTGDDNITESGFVNNFNFFIKNLNSIGKNNSEYKSSPQLELMSLIEFRSEIPMTRSNDKNRDFLTPKLKIKINPSDMKDYSSSDRNINTDNIFYFNRLGINDTLEAGRSLTIGVDYKKEKLNEINKYFEFKIASSFRDKEEKFISKKSTLNRKHSNLFGTLTNSFSENFQIDYNFSIDNDYNTLEYSQINTKLNYNNFVTELNFLKESGEIGNDSFINLNSSYEFDQNNSFSFKTRRNRKLNLTEYYDLVYQYKNDCLTAGIKYKKNYYKDRDLEPTEDLFFSVTFIPLTSYEQKIEK